MQAQGIVANLMVKDTNEAGIEEFKYLVFVQCCGCESMKS